MNARVQSMVAASGRFLYWRSVPVKVVRVYAHTVRVKDLATGQVFTVHPDDMAQSVDSPTR